MYCNVYCVLCIMMGNYHNTYTTNFPFLSLSSLLSPPSLTTLETKESIRKKSMSAEKKAFFF